MNDGADSDRGIHPDLMEMLAAVNITDDGAIAVRGAPIAAPTGGGAAADNGHDRVADLATALYRRCYVRPSGRVEQSVFDADRDGLFSAQLLAAVPDAWVWEQGWTVTAIGPDGTHLRVRRGAVYCWCSATQVRPLTEVPAETAPVNYRWAIGSSCTVRVPRVRRHLIPGFHTVVGAGQHQSADAASPLLRLYWHIRQEFAASLLASTQRSLDDLMVPFTMKVLRSPLSYVRADAAVLYLRSNRLAAARDTLATVHHRHLPGLRPQPPLLTYKLAHGLGLAEDPGAGVSFGDHSCRIVAEAVWKVLDRDGPETAREIGRLAEAVGDAYAAHDLDARAPHLARRRSADEATFTLEYPPLERPELAVRSLTPVRPGASEGSWAIEGACAIGDLLRDSARWEHTSTRCTWIARAVSGRAGPAELFLPHSTSLLGDLYAGTAGVALFLAQLAALSDGDGTALAAGALASALHHAQRQLERDQRWYSSAPQLPTAPLIGLYAGIPGTVLTALRVSRLLGADPDLDSLQHLLAEAIALASDAGDDLLTGYAGGILALLKIADDIDWPAPDWALTAADRIGARLASNVNEHGPAGRQPREGQAWTGLSHGTAGISLALLTLGKRLARADLVDMGRRGFAYEDALYDPVVGNWPDYRDRPFDASGGVAYATAWCNGAPGIALTRLAAQRVDPDRAEVYQVTARAGIAAARNALQTNRLLADRDATLCHGAAGLVDTLLVGGIELGEEALTAAAMAYGTELSSQSVIELRSGVPGGGANPTLMLGAAGVGYQLLRLAAPADVPSVLLDLWSGG